MFASIALLYVHLASWRSSFCKLDVKSAVPTSANLSGAVGSVMDFNAKAKSSTPGDPFNRETLVHWLLKLWGRNYGQRCFWSCCIKSVNPATLAKSLITNCQVGNLKSVRCLYYFSVGWSLFSGLLNLYDCSLNNKFWRISNDCYFILSDPILFGNIKPLAKRYAVSDDLIRIED